MGISNKDKILGFQMEQLESLIELKERGMKELTDRMSISKCDEEFCIDYYGERDGALLKEEMSDYLLIVYEQYWLAFKDFNRQHALRFLSHNESRVEYLNSLLK